MLKKTLTPYAIGEMAKHDKKQFRQLHADLRLQKSIDSLDTESTPSERKQLTEEIKALKHYLDERQKYEIPAMGFALKQLAEDPYQRKLTREINE